MLFGNGKITGHACFLPLLVWSGMFLICAVWPPRFGLHGKQPVRKPQPKNRLLICWGRSSNHRANCAVQGMECQDKRTEEV